MKIMVTGARGFIGSFLIENMIQSGHEVRCLLRKKPGKSWISELDFQTMEGDLSDSESLAAAVAGVDMIYHLAGCTKALNKAEFDAVNVEGTRNLLSATRKYNPNLDRFIHVSSLAAAGPSRDGTLLTEAEPPKPVSNYGKSKLASEQVARQFMQDLPIVITRPPAVYGPRDTDVFTYFKQAKVGILPLLGGGPRTASFIYVEDLVDGIILAGERDVATGEIYYLCNDRAYSWEELGETIANALAVKARQIKFPVFFSLLACAGGELGARVSRKPSIINLDKYQEIKMNHWVCSNDKARRELGFTPKFSLQDGIQQAADWYRKNGWL